MNRSIMDINGEILVISQFTLFASYKKGNRPSWLRAAKHEISIPLYEEFCKKLSDALGKPVGTGEFGAEYEGRFTERWTGNHHDGYSQQGIMPYPERKASFPIKELGSMTIKKKHKKL